MYTPKNLKKWALPRDYMGADWPEMYVFLGRTRDSDNLDNSNFETALTELGGESDTVKVICENHWAVGWVEWIGINESDDTVLQLADEMKDRLSDYPILNEDDYSQREWESYNDNVSQAVRDYCNDKSLEFTDEQRGEIADRIIQASNECGEDTWPDEDEIYAALPPEIQDELTSR